VLPSLAHCFTHVEATAYTEVCRLNGQSAKKQQVSGMMVEAQGVWLTNQEKKL